MKLSRKVCRLLTLMAATVMLSSTPLLADAEQNWKKRCAMCHGDDGTPTPVGSKMGAKDLNDPEVKAKPDEVLAQVVADGAGKMPGYADQLTADEIDAIIAHIRQITGS